MKILLSKVKDPKFAGKLLMSLSPMAFSYELKYPDEEKIGTYHHGKNQETDHFLSVNKANFLK